MSNEKIMTHIVDTHAHMCDPVFDRDRTEVLETEEALRESERRLRVAAEAATDVIWEADLRTGAQIQPTEPKARPRSGLRA